ncbi:MAG: protease complex subunit PrcB family protein [Candidatus Competibacteraceae bacterium]
MNRPGLAVLAVLALQGCAGTTRAGSDATAPVEKVYASGQCGDLDQPEVVWIADAETWRERYAQIMSQRMTPPPAPAVDFPRNGILLIAMGQQTTGGYGLSLTGAPAIVQNGVLTVRVEWREPLPGYAQAQVMTNPCLLAKLPEGAFSHIRVIDQDGRLRLEGVR